MTTETTNETDWQLPLDSLIAAHRSRIEGHEDQVPAMVEAWRIGDPMAIWTTWVGGTDEIAPRDAGLFAVSIMAATSAADYIVFSFDTHVTSLQLNPKTNKPWGPGEMQAMCDEEGFCETGQMRDNLVIAIVRRTDQKLLMHSIPYHFHKGDVLFYEESTISEWDADDKGVVMQGVIPHAMRAAMQATPLVDEMTQRGFTPDLFGFGPEEEAKVRLHTILAGVRVLSDTARTHGHPDLYACLLPAFDDEHKEIIERSAARSGLNFSTLPPPGDDDDA